jgi:hypothetical protein
METTEQLPIYIWDEVTQRDLGSGIKVLKQILRLHPDEDHICGEIQRTIDLLIILQHEVSVRIESGKMHFNWHRLFDGDTHHTVPASPGIYLFVECDFDTMTKRVVYVGMSMNLQHRLCMSTHHAMFKWLMKNRNKNRYILRYFMPTEDCVEKELRYIKRFRPPINVRDNCDV